jgi:hypothetical protein
MVRDNFDYYTANQDEIVKGRLGEFVVIKDSAVVGYYGTEGDALKAMKGNELETFIIQKCQVPGTDVITFHNNQVAFA